MGGATHFIEVFRAPSFNIVTQGRVHPINYLKPLLKNTKLNGCITLFIWKIKPKSLTTNTK